MNAGAARLVRISTGASGWLLPEFGLSGTASHWLAAAHAPNVRCAMRPPSICPYNTLCPCGGVGQRIPRVSAVVSPHTLPPVLQAAACQPAPAHSALKCRAAEPPAMPPS